MKKIGLSYHNNKNHEKLLTPDEMTYSVILSLLLHDVLSPAFNLLLNLQNQGDQERLVTHKSGEGSMLQLVITYRKHDTVIIGQS